MNLTDARRFYVLMRDAGAAGVHSHQVRRLGVSGNPSQRAKDIVDHGVSVSTRREAVGRRPGSRYWLAEHAPADAIAVRPNHDADVGDGKPVSVQDAQPRPPASGAAPAVADVSAAEVLSWVRDWDGYWKLISPAEVAAT